jgi:hypothetical protein
MLKTRWKSRTFFKLLFGPFAAALLRLAFLAACVCCASLTAGEVDRLLVGVNGSVITEGDLYVVRSLHKLVYPDMSAGTPSGEEEIDRLIDLELISQEMKSLRVEMVDESAIEAKVRQLRDRYAASGGLAAQLEKLGISETELYDFLKLEALTMRFVDFRFRPFVRVSKEEIESYYRGKLQQQLRESGLEIPPLSEVSEKIETILTEEKINAELEHWIENARSSAKIEYFRDNGLVVPETVTE